jgi:hypothetical protein
MFRIDNAKAVAVQPTYPSAGTPGYYTKGDPNGGIPATPVDEWWLNQIQEELLALVVAGGLTPTKGTNTQIRDAVNALIVAASVNLGASAHGLLRGKAPAYVDANTVKIFANTVFYKADGTKYGRFSADQNVVLSSTGVNALDTGVKANSAHYHLHFYGKNDNSAPCAVLSLSDTMPSPPAGYDWSVYANACFTTDAAGNLIPSRILGWGNDSPLILYKNTSLTSGTLEVLAGGTASSWTAVSCATLIPANARMAVLYQSGQSTNSGAGYTQLRTPGMPSGVYQQSLTSAGSGDNVYQSSVVPLELNSSRQFEYISSGSKPLSVGVAGYYLGT